MAYEEPGVKVIQQLQLDAANIAAATQALTLVGELYEVFEDEVHPESYDALTGAGDQEFPWPSKKASSVVDLAGVRKSIAEVDSQLNEFAPYPLQWKLRDPSTSAVFDVDVITDVYAINQDRFKIVEGSGAATARAAGSNGTAAQINQLHLEAGGMISAGVVAGDRIRVTNGGGDFDVRATVTKAFDDTAFFTADGHSLTLNALTTAGAASIVADVPAGEGVQLQEGGTLILGSGATLERVEYTGAVVVAGDTHTFTLSGDTPTVFDHAAGETVTVVVKDAPSNEDDDGDLETAPGFLNSPAVNTGMIGYRVALWVEQLEATDGATDGTSSVNVGSLDLDETAVGKKLSIWSSDAGDGAVAIPAGTVSTTTTTGDTFTAGSGTPFATAEVGGIVKIDSGYHRITAVDSGTVITITPGATVGATTDGTLFAQVVRTILAVESNGNATVNGGGIAAGSGLPVVLHRAIYRNLVEDPDNADGLSVRYSGSAVTSDTGYLTQVPFEVFENTVTFEVFPNYELLVSFRALDLSSVNSELAIYAASDLTALGDVSPANPLAWAAQAALVAMGTSDELIIGLPVDLFPNDDPGDKSGYPEDKDEVLGYLLALEILSRNESVYYMVPLTQNSTVRDSFVSHCLAMSAPEEKKERICYLSYKLPLGDVESTTGEVAPGLEGGNKAIVDPGQNFLSQYNVIPGNIVVIESPASIAGEYEVGNGTTEDRLELEGDNWTQTLEMTTSVGNFGGQTGATASLDTTGGVTTLTTLAAGGNLFTDSDVGRTIVINGAADANANGSQVIVSVVDGNNITFVASTPPADAPDGNNGSIAWTVTPDNEVGSNTANQFKDAEAGDYLVVGSVYREITAVKSDGLNLYGRLEYDGAPLSLGSGNSVSVIRTSIAVNYHVRPLTKTDQASTLAAISQARGSRRVVHMWPSEVEMITGTDAFGNDVKEFLPSFYAAAAEAGRDSVIPEARSSTGLALGGFTALNYSNFYFSKSQLNTIAGGGWAILEQRVQGAPVTMRHLLTTDMSSVKTQEVSFTKNVDNMAKVKRASVEPLLNDDLGRINITQDFLTALAFPFQGIFENFVSKGQLVRTADAPPYKILSIRQDSTQPDTILEDVELNVPLPANKVVVTFII